MPIDTSNSTSALHKTAVTQLNKTDGVQPAKRADNQQTASAEFHASGAIDSSQDIDHARVSEIRQAISDGSLTLNSDRIADSIVASARELASE